MLNGFRQFFKTQAQYTPRESGLAELARLEKGHYLIALPVDLETAHEYLSGRDGLRHISRDMFVSAQTIDTMGRTAKEAIVVMPIPKRWFKEQKNVMGAIGQLLPLGEGWHLPANYVWGYFTKWHEDREEVVEPGQFYRNQNYHGHDGLYEMWKGQHPEPTQPQVLDRPTPRVVAPYSPHSARTFHGYNTFDFDSSRA